MDAVKPRSYSYLAGGCLESVSHKLPSWRELKPQWKSCYYLQKHMDRKKKIDFMWQLGPIFNDFFSHPSVGAQSMYGVPWMIFQSLHFTEDLFSFLPSLKPLRLSGYKMSPNILWQPSESSKVLLFLLPLFQSGTILKSIKQHNSNMLCIPWNRRGVKWCWQQELLLRVPVLCQIALEGEALQGMIFTPMSTYPFVLTHALFRTLQCALTACRESTSKISFQSFLSLQQCLEKVFVIKLKCKTVVL